MRALLIGRNDTRISSRARSGSSSGSATKSSPVLPSSPANGPTARPVAGTINILISDRYTDVGEGATYQSTCLDITA